MPNFNCQVSRSAIAFIDSQVEDYQSLIAGVTSGTEVVVLDGNRDAIDQITEILALHTNIDSIHIISHGAPGSLQLGKTRLCSENLETYSKQFQQWGSALNLGADILIYGCNVALTSFTFIQRIAKLTNTNVAASKNLTGSAAKGGDWELEVTTGKIAASLAFRPEVLAAYSHILSTFSEAGNYSVPYYPQYMGTGDFNSDGFLDLVVLSSEDIAILLGTGTAGGFGTPIKLFNPGSGEQHSDIAIQDFNGDGKLDLAVANTKNNSGTSQVKDGFVSIRLGTGTGSFGNPTNFNQGTDPWYIVAGDFNGDSKVDLATVSANNDKISILFGDGTGSFSTPVNIKTSTFKDGVTTADFNGDGKLDLVTFNSTSNNDNRISVFLGDGNGNFNAPINVINTRAFSIEKESTVTGDFNGDRNIDLAAINYAKDAVSVFLGDGKGNFGTAANFTVLQYSDSLIAGDFNGDGKLDLATLDEGARSNKFSLLLGDGTGNFGTANTNWETTLNDNSTNLISMVAGDFNADGKLDLATGNRSNFTTSDFSDNVSILLNTSNPVNFGAATYSVTEGTTDKVVNIPITISGGTPLSDVVVPIVLDPSSTATENSDYTFSPTSITFPAGSTGDALTKNIAVTINSDKIPENAETVIFNFGTITGGVADTTKQTTLTIAANFDISYAIATDTASIDEGNSDKKPLTFTVTRSEGTSGASSVNYAIEGTATNGSDYNNIGGTSGAKTATGTIDFVAGETSKTITIDVLGDTTVEPDETITVTLSNPTGSATVTPIITADTATTTIINYTAPTPEPPTPPTPPPAPPIPKITADEDDRGTITINGEVNAVEQNAGNVAFSYSQFSLNEDRIAVAAVTVTRSGGSDGAVSATINLKDGTAKAPDDYNNEPITVNFADGETSKTVIIPIVNDAIAEKDETVKLTLTTPTGGATIGRQNTATLTILDNDITPIITFPQGVSGSNKGETTIAIAGEKFSPTDRMSLIAPNGTTKAASKVYWVNDKEAWATFDLQGLDTGKYDIKVANEANTATSKAAFTVTDGALGNIQTKLSYPAPGVVNLTYTNVGQTDVTAPLFRLSATNAGVTSLQGSVAQENTTSTSLSQLLNLGFGGSDKGAAGILAPGKSHQISFNYTPKGNGLINFAVEQVNPNEVIDWAAIKAESRADYPFIDSGAWDAIWSNFTAAVGQTYGQFQAVMAEDANYLSQLGQTTSNLTRLYAFEWNQAANTLTNVGLISATDVVDAAPGLSLTFNRTFSQSIAERYNLGTLGRGWSSQWDLRATTESNGNVVIRSVGNLQRFFEKQTDGTLTEYGGATLTIANSEYRLTEANGIVSLFGSDGKLNYVEDTNGNRITLQYTNDLLAKLVHTNGDSLTLAYNDRERISQITDSTGQLTTYSYDTSGEHLLSVKSPEGTTTYSYDTGDIAAKKHSLLSVSSDLGYQRSFEYDDRGRLTEEFSNEQSQSLTYSYDSLGGVTVTDSTGASQTLLLDDRGNPRQIRGVNNQNLLFRYDADGNLIGTTLPNGGKTAYGYDKSGNLTKQTNLLSQDVKFTYDATFDQLTGFTDPKGNGVNYTYDPKGNPTKIAYPDGSNQQFSVDALGNITSAIDRRGNTIQYTYNKDGLLTQKQSADDSKVSYSYDTNGNLTTVTDGTGSITMQYDAANQLTNIKYPTGRSLSYTYNADGQRTKLVSEDGYTVNYSYDPAGSLKTLTNATEEKIIGYDYDSAGRLIKETNGNGTYTSYEYDLQSQLTGLINYQADNTVNSKFEYAYDNLGRRTSMTTLEGTFQYGYDATGQLTSVVTPTNRTIKYQYDAAGNRTRVTDNETNTNYTSNNLNEYTKVGNAVYTYDKDGNLISKTEGEKTSTYTYNAENRLTKVVTPPDTWEYEYDGLGNRVATVFNGQRTEYLLDPTGLGNIVGEYKGSTLVANYTHGIGLVSRVNGSNSNYYDADAIGSTVGLTANDGSYVNRYSYLPFGEDLTKVEGVANPFEYVGQWGVMDEGNGLDFMRSRFYDSGLGRFTAVDPIGINAGDTNFYRYVFNNPTQYNDPSGEVIHIPLLLGIVLVYNGGIVLHYGRNVFNNTPSSLYHLEDEGWIHSELAIFHQQDKGNENNTKWLKPDKGWFGSSEAIISGPGPVRTLVTDPLNGGTYNYFDVSWGWKIPHGFDVIPYVILGNSPDDPSTLSTRLNLTIFGKTHNDPHLTTLDGLRYDFQSVGEFTLVKSTTDNFEIQTRQQPWKNSKSASINTAIALENDGQRIAFYAGKTLSILINGKDANIPDGQLYAVGKNLITRSGKQYSITTANNDLIIIDDRGSFLNINVGLADNRQGKVVGLLGNDNGNKNDDFALRDGTVIGGTISNQQLYGEYANSWRITQATSLFDYPSSQLRLAGYDMSNATNLRASKIIPNQPETRSGQDTTTFTDLTFPNKIVTLATLTPQQRAAAEEIARKAGITDPDLLEDVILDIVITDGDPEFIEAATSQQRLETVNAGNTLINPEGVGNEYLLTANAIILNTIRFTNENPQESTPIAKVTITQQLDSDLNLDTFTLNDFGFGDITINVPLGVQNYSERLDLLTTRGVFVDVDAELDTATGIVTWTFTAIDPTTGNPANSATQGFLPPDDENGVGQGFVGYSIQPKANPSTGTRIDAQATITFNSQTPIQTTPVFNTLDNEIPTSTVNPVPTNSSPESIESAPNTPDTETPTNAVNSLNSGILTFSNPEFSIKEDGSAIAPLKIDRANGSDGIVNTTITLTDDTATSPADYNNTSITVSFADGETSKNVEIPIIDDTEVESNETIQLSLSNPSNGATIGINNTATLTIADNDTFSTPVNSQGSKNNDTLTGGNNNDTLTGGKGEDTLIGNEGNDYLDGGKGNDYLDGGKGNDYLDGGEGNDYLDAGEGNDILFGGKGKDTLIGGQGNDNLDGGKNNDSLDGGEGNDNLSGGKGEDTLIGGKGNDNLKGGKGKDILTGVDPNSVNAGFSEIDILTGGRERDKFILGDTTQFYYNDGNDADLGLSDYALITDFKEGKDSIQLHGTKSNYILGASPVGLPTGIGIFYQTTDQNELIGIVQGVSGLSLDSDAFAFVS
ncbi:DUF4347 domain-containing protein [Microcoleus sp. LAD1_D3]